MRAPSSFSLESLYYLRLFRACGVMITSGVLEHQDWEVKSKNTIRRSPPFFGIRRIGGLLVEQYQLRLFVRFCGPLHVEC